MGAPTKETPRDNGSPTVVRYFVLGSFCLAAAIAYISRNSIGVAESTIRQDLKLEDRTFSLATFSGDLSFTLTPYDQMGWVMGAFFFTYAVIQLPTGWLAHLWGTRRALSLFSILWSVAAAFMGVANGFVGLLLTRLGMGAAQSGIFPCTTSSVAKWFPVGRLALANGAIGGFMQVGFFIVTWLTTYLLSQFGPASWRWIFFGYSIPGIIWAVWFYVWFRNRPEQHPSVNDAELELIGGTGFAKRDQTPAIGREPTPWAAIFTSLPMWWICAQAFCRAAGYMFFASWFATFLQKTREVSVATSGYQTGLPVVATGLGSLAGGVVSDWVFTRTGSRRLARQGIAIVCLLVCAALILLAYGIADPWLAVLVISAGSFCAALAGPCSYTITIDMGGRHVATVFSTMNMAGNVGAFMFPIVVPPFVRWSGAWDQVLFLFAGIYLVAAICWIPINPNGTIFDRPARP